MYVFDKPETETEREHNKETRILAENVRAKRQLELRAGNSGFLVKKRQNTDFLKYFRDLAGKRCRSKSSKHIWKSSILYLTDFTNGQCTFENLNQIFVEDFKTYLLNARSRRSNNALLKSASASAYFQCFCSTLNQAVKDGLLPANPAADIEKIKTLEATREFLTIGELQKLAATECRMPDVLRRAALFSALTGLRFSDIQKLKWENVRHSEGMGYYLQFRIKKTGENLTLPISDEARLLLGEQTAPDDQVLSGAH